MIFTSNIFVFLFLPLFLIAYYLTRPSWRSVTIVAGSYLFYAWWRPDFLLLFVAVTYWNYTIGNFIDRRRESDPKLALRMLTLGVIGNLAALGYFKYANFGVDVISAALAPLGINTFTLEYIILPLGISFYIFQAISYIVDVYRRDAETAKSFVDFAAFIALFPQLIAGPILHYRYVAEQLHNRDHSWALFSLGATRFMLGFTKKVLIADSLAPITEEMLGNPDPQFVDSWFGVTVALLQLYFDFSGYSDMAIGLGMMMGFRFSENFNHPFLSQSMTEFWQRWHMTLGDFIRNYIYKPLLKAGLSSSNAALAITMTLAGLWHGASFAFIGYGVYCAVIMLFERRYGLTTSVKSPFKLWRCLLLVSLIVLVMPMFRTGDLNHAWILYWGMFGLDGLGSLDYYLTSVSSLSMAFVVIAVLWLIISGITNLRFYAGKATGYLMENVSGAQALLLWVGFALAVTKLSATRFSPFLYFQF